MNISHLGQNELIESRKLLDMHAAPENSPLPQPEVGVNHGIGIDNALNEIRNDTAMTNGDPTIREKANLIDRIAAQHNEWPRSDNVHIIDGGTMLQESSPRNAYRNDILKTDSGTGIFKEGYVRAQVASIDQASPKLRPQLDIRPHDSRGV